MARNVDTLPLLSVNAGPRDAKEWPERLKEEYAALIQYIKTNKANDRDWFKIESSDDGLKWHGTCWYIHELVRYEFCFEFDIPPAYPQTPVEVRLPELDGKTVKMYRGGKICVDIHFAPLWNRNVPKFGIAHVMALGLAPWLAAEIPFLVESGTIQPR